MTHPNSQAPAAAVLVINSGSSSVKYALFENQNTHASLQGAAERIGTADAFIQWKLGEQQQKLNTAHAKVAEILELVFEQVKNHLGDLSLLTAVGHRVVHGGEHFSAPCLITDDNLAKLSSLSHLAPLHNPANLQAIEIIGQQYPKLAQVAVFDTAFHQSMPEKAFRYALPNAFYRQHGIRRYGFHGTSHQFVAGQTVEKLQLDPSQHGLIVAHLGNGCSATAVVNGQSRDTSMGFTPLEGLMMGTRSGDLDPSILLFMQQQLGMSPEAISHCLNKESGLLGISEYSNDMRSLLQAQAQGNPLAQLAIDMFVYRLAKTIAGLAVALPQFDALVFTGGIGENSAPIRELCVQQLHLLGLKLDREQNLCHGQDQQGLISQASSRVRVAVIATNEEWHIAAQTQALVQS